MVKSFRVDVRLSNGERIVYASAGGNVLDFNASFNKDIRLRSLDGSAVAYDTGHRKLSFEAQWVERSTKRGKGKR